MVDSNSKLDHLQGDVITNFETTASDLLARLEEANKDAKRRAVKQKERENDAKAKLEAAVGRHAEKISEEEEAMLPAIEAGAANEAMTNAHEEQEIDDDDVPILQQVLFEAALTPASEFSLPEEDPFLQACRAALRRRTEFEAIDASAAFQELIGNNMMIMYYQRHPDCPEATARMLFQAMSCCEDARVAQRSFKTLATLCGFGDDAAMAGIRDVPPIESGIYGKQSGSLRVCQWMPGADDFLEALAKLGYRVPSMAASSKRKRGAKAGKPLTQQAPYSGPLPQLAHLTYILRLLCPICEAQAEAGGARGPAWSRFGELFLALLHLMLDRAACLLSLDIQAAMQTALGAFLDSMWERKFADLAAGAAGAGCSPGGGLAVIRAIPVQSARGRLLRRHALAALLKRAIPGKDAQAAEVRRRGGISDIDVPKELDKLAWFGSSKGVASLVADAMKEDGAHSLSDVAVALQAAHLLVWQHEVEHGGDDLVCDRWPKFLSSLQAQLVKYKQDTFPGLSSLKLLVTNLMDFPRVVDV